MDERTPDVLGRLRQGDPGSYKILFERYLGPLTSFLRSHTDAAFRRAVPIEDLLQDVHVEALRSIDRFTYRRDLSFYFWLCGIARKLIANRCRGMKRRPPAIPRPVGIGSSGSTSSDLLAILESPSRTPFEQLCLEENLH